MTNKRYTVSLDLTVEAPDKELAWEYAQALSAHLDDGLSSCHECRVKYNDYRQECDRVSEVEELDR